MKLHHLIELTADIVTAHVTNNTLSTGDVPTLIARVHGALKAVGQTTLAVQEEASPVPKVTARASIKPDYLVCMECGSKHVMLRRHLRFAHSMTPPEYRKRFDLPHDYPMSPPNYSAKRREMAQAIGLGRKPKKSPRQRLSISSGHAKGRR